MLGLRVFCLDGSSKKPVRTHELEDGSFQLVGRCERIHRQEPWYQQTRLTAVTGSYVLEGYPNGLSSKYRPRSRVGYLDRADPWWLALTVVTISGPPKLQIVPPLEPKGWERHYMVRNVKGPCPGILRKLAHGSIVAPRQCAGQHRIVRLTVRMGGHCACCEVLAPDATATH